MINKTELRIGNKVLLGNDIVTVKEIGEFELSFDDGKFLFTYDRFKPIPLSPEVLQACGFQGIDQHDGTFDFFRLPKCPKGIASWVEFNSDGQLAYHYGGFIKGIEVKYLHHLQNIFMDATGSELTVNLEQIKA